MLDDDEIQEEGEQTIIVSEMEDGEIILIENNIPDMVIKFTLTRETAIWLAREILIMTGENL